MIGSEKLNRENQRAGEIEHKKLYEDDTGFKYLKNYSYKEYDHHPQNWGIVQNKNGIIYIANQGGVLEFDGVSWRVIYDPPSRVRSIAIDEKGTIYVGGGDEIGYLAPNKKGTLRYNSLKGHLPANQKKFSDVWKIYTMGKHVYFDTSTFLFQWDSEQRRFVVLSHDYNAFLICEEKLFIRSNKTGLEQIVKMEKSELKTIPLAGGDEFAEKMVYMMVPYDSQRLLIGTMVNGLYIHDGKTTIPFPTEVDDYLKRNLLYHGIRLTSGDFTLATLHGGLVIIDSRGRLKHIFDKTYGMQDDKVYYVFEDIQENLWLCLDKGITKIEYTSSISFYDDRSGLSRYVSSVVRHHNNLYVGTTNGLYYLESPFNFRLIPGISGGCWGLLSLDYSLLAATSGGTFHIKKSSKQRIIEDPSYVLLSSNYYPGRVWCGTKNGLVALIEKNGQWKEEHRFEKVDQDIRFIAEDQKGDLWLVNSGGGVLKVDSPGNIDNYVVASPSLPEGEIYSIAAVVGQVILTTKNGIFLFDEKTNKIIPDMTLGPEFAGGPGSRPIFRIAEDLNKNIWFHSQSRNYHAVPGSGGTFTIDAKSFRRISTTNQVNVIYPDPDGKIIWFGGSDGLFRYDTTVKKEYRQNFQTLVRKVVANERLKNVNLIFDGHKNKTGKDSKNQFHIIEYEERNLHFEFAAPFFEAEKETQYRFFLEGYDNDWSSWDKDTKRDYTNLSPGLYTFRVQAKNVYEHVGGEDTFQFKVLPQKKQIFISYSHRDKEFVSRLTTDLANAEMSVWLDEKEIKVGDSISKKVEKGISDCDFFCLVISGYSVNSNWVDREYRIALNIQLSTGSTPKILPLLIQDVELPVFLKDIKCADFSSDYDRGIKQLLNDIEKQ